jgi:hypothetical protein
MTVMNFMSAIGRFSPIRRKALTVSVRSGNDAVNLLKNNRDFHNLMNPFPDPHMSSRYSSLHRTK